MAYIYGTNDWRASSVHGAIRWQGFCAAAIYTELDGVMPRDAARPESCAVIYLIYTELDLGGGGWISIACCLGVKMHFPMHLILEGSPGVLERCSIIAGVVGV